MVKYVAFYLKKLHNDRKKGRKAMSRWTKFRKKIQKLDNSKTWKTLGTALAVTGAVVATAGVLGAVGGGAVAAEGTAAGAGTAAGSAVAAEGAAAGASAAAGAGAAAGLTAGQTTALMIAGGAYVGNSIYSSYMSQKYQRDSLRQQKKALKSQEEVLNEMNEREKAQQRRENEQLMNSISNLTNTSFSGVDSPSLSYDKYGDLG